MEKETIYNALREGEQKTGNVGTLGKMQDNRRSHQHHQRIGRRMSQQPPLPPLPPYFNAAMMTQAYYNNVPPELYDRVQGGAFLPHLPRPLEPFPSPEVRTMLVRQIEYYFCADNLSKDVFLRQNMDEQGWVGVSLIANFNRVKQLTNDIPFILDSLRGSSVVEIQGNKMRRRNDWQKWLLPRSFCSTSDDLMQVASRMKNISIN